MFHPALDDIHRLGLFCAGTGTKRVLFDSLEL